MSKENEPEWKKHPLGEIYEPPKKENKELDRIKEIRRKEFIPSEQDPEHTGGY